MAVPGIIKRTYDIVALFALLHVAALLGVAGYLVSTGTIDGEKVRQMAAVLRGGEGADELEEQSEAEAAVAPDGAGTGPQAGRPSGQAQAGGSLENEEMLRREAQRIKTELEQKLALTNSIMLRVQMEREAFERERIEAAQRDQKNETLREDEGFKKQLAILENLSPKIAVEHLVALPDPDDAARLLAEMQPRKAKKIVEAAKKGNQLTFMQSIVRRVREVAPAKADGLSEE
jgi:flagellar motility protein MotE (MotC chaperone)